jgi:flagellin-like protein
MPRRFRSSHRGISPVVGTALFLAIVVALVAVFGGLLLGIELPNDPPPQYRHQTTYIADGAGNTNDRPYVNITLSGGRIEPGEDFYIVDGDGNTVRWDAVWTTAGPLTAGDYAHIDGYGNIKTTIRASTIDLDPGTNIEVRIGGRGHEATYTEAAFEVPEGRMAFAPGSTGGKDPFMELFLRGDSAARRFNDPAIGQTVQYSSNT